MDKRCQNCGTTNQKVPTPVPNVAPPSPSAPKLVTHKHLHPAQTTNWQSDTGHSFCCLPFGIAAIVYAAGVDGAYNSGDCPELANTKAENAKKYITISFWLGFTDKLALNVRSHIFKLLISIWRRLLKTKKIWAYVMAGVAKMVVPSAIASYRPAIMMPSIPNAPYTTSLVYNALDVVGFGPCDLLNGRLLQAFRHNPLMVISIPYLLVDCPQYTMLRSPRTDHIRGGTATKAPTSSYSGSLSPTPSSATSKPLGCVKLPPP